MVFIYLRYYYHNCLNSGSRKPSRPISSSNRDRSSISLQVDDLLFGVHAVGAALSAGRRRPYQLIVKELVLTREERNDRLEELVSTARNKGIPVREAHVAALDELSRGILHQVSNSLFRLIYSIFFRN